LNAIANDKSKWLLLLYGLPASGNTARVNLWRKLKKFGAIQWKTSAYILPDDPEQYERLQWLATEIKESGGEATLIRVSDIEGVSDEEIIQFFNRARATEYQKVEVACRGALKRRRGSSGEELATELSRQQRRFREIRAVDYFGSSAASGAELVLQRFEKTLRPKPPPIVRSRLSINDFSGKTWLTRPRPGIDRCGSAWLIRKFIDGKAKFVFGKDPGARPNALAFDMSGAEFSHHGDDCTFETLAKRFGIPDPAVLKMAEMVHDADLEDEKFQRPECVGINAVLTGWARTRMSDTDLLEKGMDCFEGLYQQLQK
jgi:hypothetical protein